VARGGGAAATLGVVALLALGAVSGGPPASPDASGLAPTGSPRLGSGAIEVVEFADFQCPGCAALAPTIADLASSNEMSLVFRYFPLDSLHANADRSARAAAAADQLGSFWPMSEALFARQDAWKDLSGPDADAFFKGLATDLGLDVARWQAAYDSADVAAAVNADRQAAIALGLAGTPSLYVGGTPYTGPLSAEGIRAAIATAS
jgi:protein-disulfide isomerase